MGYNVKELSGTYGAYETPCTIFYCDGWYCVEGSQNVNFTHEYLENGVDVELVQDSDIITVSGGVHSLEELEQIIEEHENGEEE